MQDKPEAPDLLDAIADFLMKEVLPRVKEDDGLAFKTLVSWNMLGVVGRELRDGDPLLEEELTGLMELLGENDPIPDRYSEKLALARRLNTKLAEKISDEKIGPDNREIWEHVKKSVRDKLAISNPRFTLD